MTASDNNDDKPRPTTRMTTTLTRRRGPRSTTIAPAATDERCPACGAAVHPDSTVYVWTETVAVRADGLLERNTAVPPRLRICDGVRLIAGKRDEEGRQRQR